jgi:hypothetical protein
MILFSVELADGLYQPRFPLPVLDKLTTKPNAKSGRLRTRTAASFREHSLGSLANECFSQVATLAGKTLSSPPVPESRADPWPWL